MIELDDRKALRRDAELIKLLQHYVDLSRSDREAWHDRLMPGESDPAPEFARRYGKLIACGWLEQRTGIVSRVAPNEVAGCYRATPSGRGVLNHLAEEVCEVDTSLTSSAA